MELSIVTTLYSSAPYLEEFYTRASAAARKITDAYEIIFVNDGSLDNSLDLALSLYERDERVKVIDLSRNFGHHRAIMTGLARARGRLVFLIDCDLEMAPESLGSFYDRFNGANADVVYGVQQIRRDPLTDRSAGWLFYMLFNWLSTDPLPPNLLTVRLMSQRYVSALVRHKERELAIAGLWQITGFRQVPLVIEKTAKGHSTYDFQRRVALLVNAVTSFSNKPLIFIFYLGCVISLLAGLAAVDLILKRFFFGTLAAGWPSLIVSIWLLGGLNIFCLGVIGIYLSKIFVETKRRPYTIIRQLYDHSLRQETEALHGRKELK